MAICGSRWYQNGNEYICLERPGHDSEDGTMHQAETLCNGYVNW